MRKKIFALAVFFIIITPCSTVYAGTINSYEQEIISYAQGTFEYKGSLYKVDTQYINMLIEYLESDGVDLTQRHRDRVYNEAVNYIETGVLNGYLVPVNSQAEVEKDTVHNANIDNTSSSDNTGNTSGEDNHEKYDDFEAITGTFDTSNANDTDSSSTLTVQNSTTGESGANNNLPVKGEQEKLVASKDATGESGLSSKSSVSDDFIKDVLDMILDTDAIEQEPQKDVDTDNKAKEKQVLTPVWYITDVSKTDLITDKEYNFFSTYVILAILGIMLVIGIINTIILSNRKKI